MSEHPEGEVGRKQLELSRFTGSNDPTTRDPMPWQDLQQLPKGQRQPSQYQGPAERSTAWGVLSLVFPLWHYTATTMCPIWKGWWECAASSCGSGWESAHLLARSTCTARPLCSPGWGIQSRQGKRNEHCPFVFSPTKEGYIPGSTKLSQKDGLNRWRKPPGRYHRQPRPAQDGFGRRKPTARILPQVKTCPFLQPHLLERVLSGNICFTSLG